MSSRFIDAASTGFSMLLSISRSSSGNSDSRTIFLIALGYRQLGGNFESRAPLRLPAFLCLPSLVSRRHPGPTLDPGWG